MKDRAYIKLSVMFRSNGEGSVDCEGKKPASRFNSGRI